MWGGRRGRGESNFLLPLGCIYRLLLLSIFPRGVTALWGGSAPPFSIPPSPAAMGAAVGAQAAWGRGLCPWEDAAGDDLVGKKRRNDPPATGVCACERERKRGKKVSFPQNSAVQHSKGTRCGARRRSVASP